MDVAIIGAGLSGLSCAYLLQQQGYEIGVFETSKRAGGMIATKRHAGFQFELGANSFLSHAPMIDFLRKIGLEDKIVYADERAKHRFISVGSVMQSVPTKPSGILNSRILTCSGKMALLIEPFRRVRQDDCSVSDFFKSRIGRQSTEYLVDAFASGIWAGDIKKLSMRSAFPVVWDGVQKHGSLFGWMRTRHGSLPKIASFRDGMGALPQYMVAQLNGCVHYQSTVEQIECKANQWLLHADGHTVKARRLVFALPWDTVTSMMCAPNEVRLCAALSKAPICSVALGFKRSDIAHALDGFGVLFPRVEGRQTLGAIFSSSLFEHTAPQDSVLLTAFIGGKHSPYWVDCDDDSVQTQVMADLSDILGIQAAPIFLHVMRWHQGIVQYEVGHEARMRTIRQWFNRQPGLYYCGSAEGGVSIAQRIAAAQSVSAQIIESIRYQ